jgi:HD-GYP domain-containing protein (c-di-GMP phosphodiesterase class II)
MRRVSNRLARTEDDHRTLSFILRQGCAATGADLGVLQLPGARLPLWATNPLQRRPRFPVSSKILRQLSGRLWWRVGVSSGPHLHGPLAEILEGSCPLPGAVRIALSRVCPDQPKAGFLAYLRADPRPFTGHELRILQSLAEQTSVALQSANLHEDAGHFLMSTVKSLVTAIEAKDPYTSGHSSRVNLISMLLGKELGLSASDLESLRWASILHDVGKIGMPEAILNKPGPLSPAEFDVVRQHPWRGYEVLNHIRQLRVASQAVLFHHERVDGNGYPMGISGSAIPQLARIIAVADTYDALTSTRPYRTARSADEAHAEIRRVRGQQLDAKMADALGEMLPFLKEHQVMLAPSRASA